MSDADIGIQLELKDRLNYAGYIQKFMELTQSLNSKIETPTKIIQQVLLDFLQSIPTSWKDKEFLEDLNNVMKEVSIDNRPSFSGVTNSLEFCKKRNIKPIRKVKRVDYYKLKNAIVNLLDRRQMLIRREKIEFSTGRNLEHDTYEDLLEEIGEDDLDDEDIE